MKKNLLSKILFLLVCLVSMSWSAMAQSQTITGKVTDEKGEALVGVNIILKETSRGTSTNIDGKYTISVPGASSQLTFTSVGYDSKTITVGSQTLINVVLAANAQNLSEVVVMADVQQKRESIWADLNTMAKAKLFIGTWSQVSQLASVCVVNRGGVAYLPSNSTGKNSLDWKVAGVNFYIPNFLGATHPIYFKI
jgi:hypothetical protein